MDAINSSQATFSVYSVLDRIGEQQAQILAIRETMHNETIDKIVQVVNNHFFTRIGLQKKIGREEAATMLNENKVPWGWGSVHFTLRERGWYGILKMQRLDDLKLACEALILDNKIAITLSIEDTNLVFKNAIIV